MKKNTVWPVEVTGPLITQTYRPPTATLNPSRAVSHGLGRQDYSRREQFNHTHQLPMHCLQHDSCTQTGKAHQSIIMSMMAIYTFLIHSQIRQHQKAQSRLTNKTSYVFFVFRLSSIRF